MESELIESVRVGRSLYLRPCKELVYFWKKKKENPEENNRSKNRTFYIWNDFVLKMKQTVLKIEPISTLAISTPTIRTPIEDGSNHSKNETKKEPPKSTPVWNAYSRAYLNRYRVSPLRGVKVNTLLGQFVDQVGKEYAPEVAAYYISLNDQWYQKKGHDVATLLQNAQSIYTQWATGTNNTTQDYRKTERITRAGNDVTEIEAKIRRGEL